MALVCVFPSRNDEKALALWVLSDFTSANMVSSVQLNFILFDRQVKKQRIWTIQLCFFDDLINLMAIVNPVTAENFFRLKIYIKLFIKQ